MWIHHAQDKRSVAGMCRPRVTGPLTPAPVSEGDLGQIPRRIECSIKASFVLCVAICNHTVRCTCNEYVRVASPPTVFARGAFEAMRSAEWFTT